MTKYHVNKEGDVKVCTADSKCPFKRHFDNDTDAYKFTDGFLGRDTSRVVLDHKVPYDAMYKHMNMKVRLEKYSKKLNNIVNTFSQKKGVTEEDIENFKKTDVAYLNVLGARDSAIKQFSEHLSTRRKIDKLVSKYKDEVQDIGYSSKSASTYIVLNAETFESMKQEAGTIYYREDRPIYDNYLVRVSNHMPPEIADKSEEEMWEGRDESMMIIVESGKGLYSEKQILREFNKYVKDK